MPILTYIFYGQIIKFRHAVECPESPYITWQKNRPQMLVLCGIQSYFRKEEQMAIENHPTVALLSIKVQFAAKHADNLFAVWKIQG